MTDVDVARQRAIEESGWAETFRFVQPHNPAFWLYIGLFSIGTYQFVNIVAAGARVFSPAMVVAAAIWGLALVPWVWFINHKDRFHRSTGRVALAGFGWGAMVATWVMALPGNAAVSSIIGKVAGSDVASSWGASLSAPLVEESSKGMGIVMLVLLARPHLRNAYDGFILGAFVGLGFQVAEDWLYGVNSAAASFGIDQLHAELGIFMIRGTFSALVSHALYSALVGAGVGWWVANRDNSLGTRLSRTVPLVGLAWFTHFAWDSVGALGVVVIPLSLVFGIVLIGIVKRWTERNERGWITDLLAPEIDSGIVTSEEVALLAGSPHDRRTWVRRAAGKDVRRASRHLLDAELDLVDAIARARGATDESVVHARSEVARLRAARAGVG